MQTQLVILNDQKWFESQKIAGQCVAKCLKTFKNLVESHSLNINLLDIEAHCVDIMKEFDCEPTFYLYKGFPGKVCLSVNKELVHGIPKDYILKDGDIVSLDLGATHKDQGNLHGIADAALTCIYGKPKKTDHQLMLDVCYKALMKGIEAVQIGKQIGCIGYAIHKYVKSYNFGLITEYGGHGVNKNKVHSSPFVPNKSRPDEGIRIQPGLTIAIEPQLVCGGTRTKKGEDGWTVYSLDGVSSHFEKTIYVGEDKVHIMTDWESTCL